MDEGHPAPEPEVREALPDRMMWGLIDAAPDGLVMVDASGRIVLVNRQTESLFGYRREELLGASVEDLVPVEARDLHREERAKYLDAPSARPMGAGLILQGRRRDGSLFPVEISLSPLHVDGDQVFVIAAVRDVSDRLAAEDELAAALRHAVVVADRERLARDMHDNVIQELFATGMALEAAASTVDTPDMVDRLIDAVDSIDRVIKQIRSTIFGLRDDDRFDDTVQGKVLKVAASASEVLGFEPVVKFVGPVEALSTEVVEHLLSIVREALANIARHAGATEATVALEVDEELIRLNVSDNGVGIAAAPNRGEGFGLRNMHERAVSLGGACEISADDGGGTRVVWQVPVQPS